MKFLLALALLFGSSIAEEEIAGGYRTVWTDDIVDAVCNWNKGVFTSCYPNACRGRPGHGIATHEDMKTACPGADAIGFRRKSDYTLEFCCPGVWGETCQDLSNYYGADHGKTWGCAPQDAKAWWTTNGCKTRPNASTFPHFPGCKSRYSGNPWRFLDRWQGVPVRCAGPGKMECASKNGKDCLWGKYSKQKPYSFVGKEKKNKHPVQINCPGWGSKDGSDPCEVLGCYKKEGNDVSVADVQTGSLTFVSYTAPFFLAGIAFTGGYYIAGKRTFD